MSENTESAILEIQETIQHRIDQIAETLEQADNLENTDNLETEGKGPLENENENLEKAEVIDSIETQKSDNLEKADTQKPEIERFEADEIYNTTTPLSNAILHRMYKIEIQNENLKEYYMNNLITSMIRDVIGHARRRLTKIRYTSLGITKQEDDIYKAKGLYKEKEFMTIQQTLQKKFPSADIKITKQKPLSENHIPIDFELSWEALDLGEEIEEEIVPPVEVKASEPASVPEIKVKTKTENITFQEKRDPPKIKNHAVTISDSPILADQEKQKLQGKQEKREKQKLQGKQEKNEKNDEYQKKLRETELNKKMDADYAIQKYLLRKRHG